MDAEKISGLPKCKIDCHPARLPGNHAGLALLFLLATLLFSSTGFTENTQPVAGKQGKEIGKGTFLVASEKLANSGFKETVILITHYSDKGTTGLAINRPSRMTLNQAFPDLKQFSDNNDELYLGGPVHSNAIFVLLQTPTPSEKMRKIVNDFYFAPGIKAFSHNPDDKEPETNARAFAGYSGWVPGQLEQEIRRGDWLVIQSDPAIIFSEGENSLWKRLHQSWSGSWI